MTDDAPPAVMYASAPRETGSVRDPHAALLRMLETAAQQREARRTDVEKLQRSADDYDEL